MTSVRDTVRLPGQVRAGAGGRVPRGLIGEPAQHGILGRDGVGHPGGQHQRAAGGQHDHREDQQTHHRPRAAASGGEQIQVQHPVDAGGHQGRHDHRRRSRRDGVYRRGIEHPARRPQRATQQQMSQQCADREAKPIGGAEVAGHQFGVIGEVRSQQREDDLHRRDRDDDQDRCPRLFARVEHPQLQQHQRVGDQGERRHRDRDAEVVRVDLTEVAIGEQRAADRRTADGHQRHHRDERHHREPGGQRQVGAHRGDVLGGGVAAQSRHDDRQDRHADHAERQHEHQPGVVVDRRPGSGCGAGDLVADDQADLADQHVEHHGRGHHAEAFEPRVDAPQRPQADPFGADGDQEHRGLGDHAESCADAQNEKFGAAHGDGVDRQFARHEHEQSERGDGDDVVDHRGPSGWSEHVAVVQDRHEDR